MGGVRSHTNPHTDSRIIYNRYTNKTFKYFLPKTPVVIELSKWKFLKYNKYLELRISLSYSSMLYEGLIFGSVSSYTKGWSSEPGITILFFDWTTLL